MNNYVIALGIIYLVIVTFIMAKIMMEKKDPLIIPRKKKNKNNKNNKIKKPEHFNDYDVKAEYADIIGDGIENESKQSDDDKLFARSIRPNNKIAVSGKNLQYQILKDGFQIAENGSAKTGHIDSMCGIAMSDYGA